MEIDHGINCFSPELDGGQGLHPDHTGLFSDCTDHAFSNTILMVRVWRVWFVYCASSREDISEAVIVIFSWSIITPESLDLVSHRVYSVLK
jgi:hypothetical protein